MYRRYLIIATLLNLTLLALSCQSDIECQSMGFVCSTVPPTKGSCIYACHHDEYCSMNEKCDPISPHWLCTCTSSANCPNGSCEDGHCIYSCVGVGCSVCSSQTVQNLFQD